MIVAQKCLAAVFTGPGHPLTLEHLPVPRLGPGEVLVRVTCCTLCGSDLHTFQGRRTTPTPTILGHEIVGKIAGLGPGAPFHDYGGKPLQLGDRVTWPVTASCGDCFYCDRDLPQKCERLFKYGHEKITTTHALSGGLAEYCHLALGSAMVRLPDVLQDSVAAPSSCATATAVAALRAAGGCENEVVLIQGAGMLGLNACALARLRGAREVIICDVDADRLGWAGLFGVSQQVLWREGGEELAKVVKKVSGGRGVDVALEMSGAPSAIEAGLTLLGTGGRYVLVGAVFPTRAVAVEPETVIRRLLTIRGVHNYTAGDLNEAVSFLAQNHQRYPFAQRIGATFPLREARQAFQHAIEKRPLRVAVRPADPDQP